MVPNALRSFMTRLRRATDDRAVTWTTEDNRVFSCAHRDYSLFISSYFDPEREEASFLFRIRRSSGDASFTVTDTEEDFAGMRNLYDSVSVNASNFEDIEDDFFGENQKLKR